MLSEKYVNPWLKQETTEFDCLSNKYWIPGKYGVSVAPIAEEKYVNPWLKQETWIVTTPEVTPITEPFMSIPWGGPVIVSCTVTVQCPEWKGSECFAEVNPPYPAWLSEEWLKEKKE